MSGERCFDHLGLRGDAEAANLAGGNQLLERGEAGLAVAAHSPEGFVQEEEVHVVGAECAQAGFEAGVQCGDAEMSGGRLSGELPLHGLAGARSELQQAAREGLESALEGARRGGKDAELGGEQHGIAAATQELAEQGFGLSIAVGTGGVEEDDAGVIGCGEGCQRGLAADPSP